MLLSRLGLRADEVATLTLDDVDWGAGEILVRAKGRQRAAMPIPLDVGEAVVAYLRDGRPRSPCRELFLRSLAPHIGFRSGSAVTMIAKTALERAGIRGYAHQGAHIFRHSLATELLHCGATLSEIGQLLRHKSHDTTRIYAKVDIEALRTLLNGEHLDFDGEFYKLKLDPPRITTLSGKCPPFYFGGLSHEARECAAEAADVYLMWPDTMDKVRENIADLKDRAATYGRTLKFGYRAHVIVRETEDEARHYADRLLSKLDDEAGRAIREKSLDAKNYGVQRQQELRGAADGDGFVEENLWTGIGRARSGCGAAIVGTPDQVLAKLRAYQAEGIEAFILSGYPHAQEADLFARHVLPHIQHAPLEM
jgi:alkanesulfonate monooxygenase SsuD/methylene tetrahydromethanopterin reductase-like flavin-dependent oxidoreductase (luciferase family)